METFGQWLRRHRNARGLSLKELEERSGVSFSYISTLERGQRHTITDKAIQPTRGVVQSLAKAVGGNLNEALKAAGWDAPENSAGWLFRINEETEWDSLTPEQQEAVKDLVLSTIHSLAAVSKEVVGQPVAPESKTPILKAKTRTEDKRKAQ